MSRIKQKKQGINNYLEFTNNNNNTATIGYDGIGIKISSPLVVTGSITTSGNIITSSGVMLNTTNVGTVGAATVTAVESGDGIDHTTVLTLTDFALGDVAGAAAKATGAKLYTFPAGVHYTMSAYQSLSLKVAGTVVAAADTGLGSVVGTGVQALLSSVGSTAEDYTTGQTNPTAPAGGAVVAFIGATGATISSNLSGHVKDIFLNSAGTWNANNTGGLFATGKVVLRWTTISS